MTSKLLYRPKEIQEACGFGNTKFWQLVKEGHFDVRKIGRATVVTDESLQRFVKNLPTS
jgi:predicted DNA-binding transcriptional regulator AlpA